MSEKTPLQTVVTPYHPPLRDLRFLFHETLRLHERADLDGFDELTPDLTDAILTEAGRLAADRLAPLNPVGDREGCRLEPDPEGGAPIVRTPSGFSAAFEALREGEWPALECAPEWGGQGMPSALGLAVGELQSSANMAIMMFSGLTHGAYSAIEAHGTDAQKALYLPKLANCEWTGTMNLTEPQCGTDLGLIRTKAVPAEPAAGLREPERAFRISGQKIFISAGEHDLAGNIVHLVLARLPEAPEGVKGISLFVVPKFLPDAEGAPGARNALRCGKLERKMGIHGSPTCVMDYDGALGWLVGEPHKGLRAMFTMMNEARLLVAMQGLAQATRAYQAAADYARERRQGRAVPSPAEPEAPADPLLVHPDVRRMLMDQRAFVEGGRAFLIWGALLIDAEKRAKEEQARADAGALIALLTPVLKGFLTDKGYESASLAMQIYGGHGYIEDSGVSQLVRDARIAMIYEGANGVQALDLVGRKVPAEGGRAMRLFFAEAASTLKATKEDARLGPLRDALKAGLGDLEGALGYFLSKGMAEPNEALAGSTDFLHLFGQVGLSLMWLRMGAAASAGLDRGEDTAFYEAKLATAAYAAAKLTPETALRRARIEAGAATVMALPAEAF